MYSIRNDREERLCSLFNFVEEHMFVLFQILILYILNLYLNNHRINRTMRKTLVYYMIQRPIDIDF